jgi:putative Ca2+/H+ antiporter (TMEM165/GDT1 family)
MTTSASARKKTTTFAMMCCYGLSLFVFCVLSLFAEETLALETMMRSSSTDSSSVSFIKALRIDDNDDGEDKFVSDSRRRSLLAEEAVAAEPITEETAEAISEDVQDAADAVDEATETVADAADSIEEANEAIAEVAEQTEEAVEAVEEASEAVAESTEAIEDAADAVDDATEAVEDAAAQIQDTADTVEEVAADVEDATAAVDEATEAVEDAADNLADITDTAQEVLSNLEGSKAVNALVMDKVEQEQGAVATELLTMAKEINRLEAVVTRLENYESGGRRGGPGYGPGLGAWFKAQYADQTSFISGLVTSFLVILFIEVGDRTYFIAALMSVKHSRRVVFFGAFSALAVMTIVSTLLGVAAPMFLPRWFVHWAAVILFLGYGVTMLYNSQFMSDDVSEEFEEVEHELDELANQRSGKKSDDNNSSNDDDDLAEKGKSLAKRASTKNEKQWWEFFVSAIFVQAFTLTFLAEWGDRSQIATIAMAADYDPYGIIIGGSLGHGLATSTACIGGRILAQKISEKKIAMVGGFIFLLFGILAVFDDPSADYAKALPSWMKTSSSSSAATSST